jgi:site-specific DNA recombinase
VLPPAPHRKVLSVTTTARGRAASRSKTPAVGPEDPSLRIATYTRISTDEAHQPYSLEAQEGRLRAYVESQPGWMLVRSFTDQQSGAKLDRPQLQRALTEARAGRFDVLLVYRVDRLARSVRGLAQILEELDNAGVAFRSATEPFDTASPAGRMMVQMLGVFAEFERSTIIDRVIAGMERKAARGGWLGGPAPYGYARSPGGGALVVDTDEAPLIPVIYDLYANQRLGAHAIASRLTKQGHRSRSGGAWGNRTILTLLRNRVYLGEVNFRGQSHPSTHPPLVDPETFDRAVALLDMRGENPTKRASNASDYLLTGLIVCQHCGKRFIGTAATGKLYRYRYYTCFSRSRYGSHICNAERLPADELDDAILKALHAAYGQTDLMEKAIKQSWEHQQADQGRRVGELHAVDSEITKAEHAVDRYLTAFENGTLTETDCGTRIRRHSARIAELRQHRITLSEDLDERPHMPTNDELNWLRTQLEAALHDGPNPARKALIATLVAEIRVEGRDQIRPTFRIPQTGGEAVSGVRDQCGAVGRQGLEP